MRKNLRTFVCLLMALWLPMNGYGAVVMPFCEHGGADMSTHAAMPAGDHSGMAHHGNTDSNTVLHGSQSVSTDDTASALACNDCGVCHLACSPLLMSEAAKFESADHDVFILQKQPALGSFSPEQPQRPPKTAL
jgi:hypothetical protein